MQRILNSKNLIAFVLAAATGMTLYFRVPFPEGNTFLLIMALRSPSAFEVLKYSYTLFLFSTPYIGYSVVLSGLYIFALKAKRRIRAGRLLLFPDPRKRDDLFLVLGEVHNPRKQAPAESPQWLVIPERGLFTGVAILGAIGSGKTSCCMYPFAEQILAYRSDDTEKENLNGDQAGALFLRWSKSFGMTPTWTSTTSALSIRAVRYSHEQS